MADLAYIRKACGTLHEIKVAFFGEATNLAHSWLEAAARQPVSVVQCCPKGYEIAGDAVEVAMESAVGTFHSTQDMEEALEGALVVYTDCWPRRRAQEEHERIQEAFAPYQISAKALDLAGADVLFLPCPPVTRGEEVSSDAMESPFCRVYEAKEYLLHAQNAVLGALLEER